uniref:LuxR C-terminal-related transcriptional regulator n=1 Tax=Fulvivirga sp. TaxID=1931237 RepID=UPI00404951C5
MIYIGIIEDQFLFREGIKAIIDNWSEMNIIYESAEGYSVIDEISNSSLQPHVLLVDLSLPPKSKTEEYNGLQLTQDVLKAFPDMKILILSVHDDQNFISQLIENGAHGYLVKDCDPKEVREAINSVYHKGVYVNKLTLNALKNGLTHNKKKESPVDQSYGQLTKREIEILELICQQLTTDEIADKLFISSKTVNGHRNNLLQKTGCRNAAGLVIYALKHHIINII